MVDVGADVITNVGVTRSIVVSVGTAQSYQWTALTGAANVNIATPTASATTITATTDGTYSIQGTATDVDSQSGSDTFTLLWDSTPPSAPATLKTTFGSAAGADVRYTKDTTVFFVWSAASDGSGSGVRDYTVEWFSDGVCGTSAGTQAGVVGLSHSITAADGDVLSFKVTAFDELAHSAVSGCSSSITVDTQAPPALSSFTGGAGTTTQTVTLNFAYSSTADYARMDLRRIEGATFPNDCTSGFVAKSYTSSFPAALLDDTGGAGRTFSYRVCIYDLAGNETKSNTVSAIVSKPHRMFATSKLFNGSLVEVPATLTPPSGGETSLAKADYFCNLLGQGISAEPWRALLSDSETDARTHVAVTGVVQDHVDSAVISVDGTNLWDGTIDSQVYYDEIGGSAFEVWTGTNANGTRNAAVCTDWSSSAAGVSGMQGVADVPLDSDWIAMATATCNTTRSLYCISHPADDPFIAFSAVTGGSAGQILLSVTPPLKYGKVERIKVYRVAGTSAPDTNCATGTLVGQMTAVTAAAVSFTDTGLAAGAYSYRACSMDPYGNVLTSSTQTNVLAN